MNTNPLQLNDKKAWERYDAVGKHYADSEHDKNYQRLVHQRNIWAMTKAIRSGLENGQEANKPSGFLTDITDDLQGLHFIANLDTNAAMIQDVMAKHGIYLNPSQVRKYFFEKSGAVREVLFEATNTPPTADDHARTKLLFQILHDALEEYLKTKKDDLKSDPGSTYAIYKEMLSRVKDEIKSLSPTPPFKSLYDHWRGISAGDANAKDINAKKTWDALTEGVKLDKKGENVNRNNFLAHEFYRVNENAGIRALQDKSFFVNAHHDLTLGAPSSLMVEHEGKPRRGSKVLQSRIETKVISFINIPFTMQFLCDCINAGLAMPTFEGKEPVIGGKPNPFHRLPPFKIGDSPKWYVFAATVNENGDLKWCRQEVVEKNGTFEKVKENGKDMPPSVLSQYEISQIKDGNGQPIKDFYHQAINAVDTLIKQYNFGLLVDKSTVDAELKAPLAPVTVSFDNARSSVGAALGKADPLEAEDKAAYVALIWGNLLYEALQMTESDENTFVKILEEKIKVYEAIHNSFTVVIPNKTEAGILHHIMNQINASLMAATPSALVPEEREILSKAHEAYQAYVAPTGAPLRAQPQRKALNKIMQNRQIALNKANGPQLGFEMMAEQSKAAAQRDPTAWFANAGATSTPAFIAVSTGALDNDGMDYLAYGFAQLRSIAGLTSPDDPLDIDIHGTTFRFVPKKPDGTFDVMKLDINNNSTAFAPNSDKEGREELLAFRSGLAQVLLESADTALEKEAKAIETSLQSGGTTHTDVDKTRNQAQKDELQKVKILLFFSGNDQDVTRHPFHDTLVEPKSSNKPGSR